MHYIVTRKAPKRDEKQRFVGFNTEVVLDDNVVLAKAIAKAESACDQRGVRTQVYRVHDNTLIAHYWRDEYSGEFNGGLVKQAPPAKKKAKK